MDRHFSKLELLCEQHICTALLKAPPLNIITRQRCGTAQKERVLCHGPPAGAGTVL